MFNQPYFYLKEKMKKTLIEIKNLEYSSTNSDFVMKIDSFNFPSGKSLLISGESGSGKTTFLNLLSGTILPQKGEITILGKNLSESSSVKKDKIRGDNYPVTDRSVDFQIVGLRKKMGKKGKLINTIRGVGYRFQLNET